MSDNQDFQFVPDGLVDGAIAAEVSPPDLRAAVNVLRAAGGPGSAAELSTMATHVKQFSAEVNAAAARISADTNISTTAFHDATRSTTMITTRITRRALSIVAITLLAAGTAAAAAGGVLPMFEGDDAEVVVETDDTDAGVEDDTQESDTTEQSDDQATDASVVLSIRPNHNGDVDHHGKCTAWTNGAAKSALNPAFAELQVSADAAGLTIDEYCATVLETPEADDDEDGDDESDDDEAGDDESDDGDEDHGNGNSNNGNGNGNSGNGNGNSGTGNGESDD